MEISEGFECVDAVLAGGGQVAADGAERFGAGPGAQPAADLLSEFDHADVAFGEVVVERHAQVVREAQYVGGEPAEACEGVDRGWTGAPARRGGIRGLPAAMMVS